MWGTIRERYNGRPLAQEGHERLTGNASFFYTDDGMLASTDLGWLQSVFDTLMGMVGLRKNVHKIVGMVGRPCRVSGVRAYKAMTGEGRSFKERQRERVLFPECGKEVAKGSLVAHRQTQQKVERDVGVYRPGVAPVGV